jgi:ComEC/Rec2-related protein
VLDAAGAVVVLSGTVEEKRELAFYRASYVLRTEINGVSTRILLIAPESGRINTGDIIEAEVTLSEFRDTGTFPERSYNHSRGILLRGSADSVELTAHGRKTGTYYIREYNAYITKRISAAFPNEHGALLRAVFLGDKGGLTPAVSRDIRMAGAAHYTSVSGLHMTMIAHMLMLAFGLTPLRKNRRAKFGVLTFAVVILALFFNLTVSVTRAAIMLVIFYGGELFMRRGTTLNSLCFALIAILLFEPYAITDAGLLMSFSGTFGVGVVAPAITRKRRLNRVAESFVVSVCASVCVLPVSALFFGGISLLSPLTSVIILPFFAVAVGALVLFAATGGAADVFLLIAGIMARIMNEIIALLGQITAAWIPLDYWFVPIWAVLAIAAVAAVRLLHDSARAVKSACIAVAALALMVCVYNMNAVNSERTYISIYSDSVAARVTVTRGNTTAVIVTTDTPTAEMQVAPNDLVFLLGSSRNNAAPFGGVTEQGVYDISGRFTLDVGETETVLTSADGFTLLFTRASNDNASPADVVVASGWVRNLREFDATMTVYVSRSIEWEHNAYFEPVYLVL